MLPNFSHSWKFNALFTKQGCTITESARLRCVERVSSLRRSGDGVGRRSIFLTDRARWVWRLVSVSREPSHSRVKPWSCVNGASPAWLTFYSSVDSARGWTRVARKSNYSITVLFALIVPSGTLSLSLFLSGVDIWNFCRYLMEGVFPWPVRLRFNANFDFIAIYSTRDRIVRILDYIVVKMNKNGCLTVVELD